MTYERYQFWTGVLIIWLTHLVMDFMLGVWTVYKTLVGFDLVLAGLIAGLGMFIGEGLQLYFGIISARGFHQRMMVLGIALTATVPFFAYIQNEWLAFAFVLCAYVGSGAFHPSATGLLVSKKNTHKSFLIALFACGGMIGAAFSQYVYVYIYSTYGGHTWMLALPIIMLCFLCVRFQFFGFSHKTQRIQFRKIWATLQPYRFELSLLFVIQVFLQIVILTFTFLLPDILREQGFDDGFSLGGGYFYFVLGSAITSVPLGLTIDHYGYKPILGIIIISSLVLLSFFLHTENMTTFNVTLLLMALGTMGVTTPVIVSGGNSLVSSQASSFVSALYMGGATCIAGFGPIIGSLIASQFSYKAPIYALQFFEILFVFAFCLLYFIYRYTDSYIYKEYELDYTEPNL